MLPSIRGIGPAAATEDLFRYGRNDLARAASAEELFSGKSGGRGVRSEALFRRGRGEHAGASHGEPYEYDSHVPLMIIGSGSHARTVHEGGQSGGHRADTVGIAGGRIPAGTGGAGAVPRRSRARSAVIRLLADFVLRPLSGEFLFPVADVVHEHGLAELSQRRVVRPPVVRPSSAPPRSSPGTDPAPP